MDIDDSLGFARKFQVQSHQIGRVEGYLPRGACYVFVDEHAYSRRELLFSCFGGIEKVKNIFDRIVRGVLIGVPRPGFLDGQDAVFHGFLPAKEVRHDSVLGFVAVVLKYGQIVGVFTHSSSSV